MKIEKPEDISTLPWKGNFASDQKLFELCEKYIQSEQDADKRWQAEKLASSHGMGEKLENNQRD
jgi:hypothetical protein